MTIPTYTLNNGRKVPAIAYGVGTISPSTEFDQAIYEKAALAIKNGYRHFDTAEIYKTEPELGRAIAESGVPRSEFFITSKVDARLGNIGRIEELLRKALADLKTDYLDLYLIHHPFFSKSTCGFSIEDAWAQLEAAQAKGLVRSIGISNFRPAEIARVLKVAKVKPAINQIEHNPYCFDHETIQANKDAGILTAAYGPLIPIARHKEGPLLPLATELAKKYSVSTAQILLKWQIQQGILAVTSSTDNERQRTQLDLESFDLTPEDIKKITEESSTHEFRLFGHGVLKKDYEMPAE